MKMQDTEQPHLIVPTEDFWSRQDSHQTVKFEFAPFGIPTQITANQPKILSAAHLSAVRFSRITEKPGKQPFFMQIVVNPGPKPPLPSDLPDHLRYTGLGPWITLSAGPWGHGFANLDTRQAVLVLSSALAAETRLVSRYFIDHYLLNIILSEWAMLHASTLLTPDRKHLIVMIAPHNSGKSTTALHLLRAGYVFVSDGMALFQQQGQDFVVGGYPLGEVKLRDDVLAMFPAYSGPLVRVREHHKTVVNLRPLHADRLVDMPLCPESINLCFVKRQDTPATQLSKMSYREVLPYLNSNTIFWDEAPRLEANSQTLLDLIRVANCYELTLGTNIKDIIATIDQLT